MWYRQLHFLCYLYRCQYTSGLMSSWGEGLIQSHHEKIMLFHFKLSLKVFSNVESEPTQCFLDPEQFPVLKST